MLASAFWQPNVAAMPIERRLLLLPGGSHCELCGRSIATPRDRPKHNRLRRHLRCRLPAVSLLPATLGYRVLWVEESVAVLAALRAEVDAVVGVASLDLLEKAMDQIPQFELPVWRFRCSTLDSPAPFDADWVRQMIELPYGRPIVRAELSASDAGGRQMFDPDELNGWPRASPAGSRLAELNGNGCRALDPLAGTEAIAYDFLTRGGKHSRPFITLAVYDAMTGGRCTLADGHRQVAELPLAVKRAAVSIETFHKASLVHDDIEDDDQFRYGEATLHRAFGVPTAINVGDFLIGLGYRLVSRESGALEPKWSAISWIGWPTLT